MWMSCTSMCSWMSLYAKFDSSDVCHYNYVTSVEQQLLVDSVCWKMDCNLLQLYQPVNVQHCCNQFRFQFLYSLIPATIASKLFISWLIKYMVNSSVWQFYPPPPGKHSTDSHFELINPCVVTDSSLLTNSTMDMEGPPQFHHHILTTTNCFRFV